MSPNQTKKPKSIRVGNFQPKVGGKKPETTQKRHRWPCLTSNFKSHQRLATNFFRPTSALWGWPELHFVTAIFRNLVQPPQQPHVLTKRQDKMWKLPGTMPAPRPNSVVHAKPISKNLNGVELEWAKMKNIAAQRGPQAQKTLPRPNTFDAEPTEKIAENMATFLQKKRFDFGGKK